MASNNEERTRYRFECECNGEIPIGETPDGAIVSCKLGLAVRKALALPGVTKIKRCIGYGGLWYVYV